MQKYFQRTVYNQSLEARFSVHGLEWSTVKGQEFGLISY